MSIFTAMPSAVIQMKPPALPSFMRSLYLVVSWPSTEIGRAHACTPVTPRSTLFPLHDALPIYVHLHRNAFGRDPDETAGAAILHAQLVLGGVVAFDGDRKSTRLHSRHTEIYTLSLTRRSSDLCPSSPQCLRP